MSYVAWLAILNGLPMLLAAAVLRRAAFARHLAARAWKSAAGGALQLAAYGLVVWALTLAPMAAVSALRETSVPVRRDHRSEASGRAAGRAPPSPRRPWWRRGSR